MQKKKYIVVGSLPEQKKYVTLSRMRVDKLNGVRYDPTIGGWTKYYYNHNKYPPLILSEVEEMAKKHGLELAKDCFYVPAGTIFYVPKGGFSSEIYLRHYKVDNPEMGHFTVSIYPTNIAECEFGEV